MMNDVLLGGNKHIVKQNDSLRVQCEASDCGALLEIEVPPGQYNSSLIVRCGNCQRLLSVLLNKGPREMLPQSMTPNETAVYTRSYPGDIAAAPLHITSSPRAEAYKRSPLTSVYLARPPPLSRTQAAPYSNKEGMPVHLTPSPHLSLPYSFGSSPVDVSECSFHGSSDVGNGTKREAEYSRRGSVAKSKKDKPARHTSPYNRFMSQEVKRIKAEHPDVDHRKAFKMAASNWARSPTSCQRMATENGASSNQENQTQSESPVSITESNDAASPKAAGWGVEPNDSSQGVQKTVEDRTTLPVHRRSGKEILP